MNFLALHIRTDTGILKAKNKLVSYLFDVNPEATTILFPTHYLDEFHNQHIQRQLPHPT